MVDGDLRQPSLTDALLPLAALAGLIAGAPALFGLDARSAVVAVASCDSVSSSSEPVSTTP